MSGKMKNDNKIYLEYILIKKAKWKQLKMLYFTRKHNVIFAEV